LLSRFYSWRSQPYEDFLHFRIDDVEDHSMSHYLDRLEKNIGVRLQL